MREIWDNFSDRERLLFSCLAVLLLAVGFFYLVIKPLQQARAAAAQDLARAEAMLARVEAGLSSARPGAAISDALDPSVRSAITSAAKKRTLSLSRIEPLSESRMTVWLEDVSSAELFNWLKELQTEQQINVLRATIQKERGSGSLIVRLELGREM